MTRGQVLHPAVRTKPLRRFARPEVVCAGWYVVGRTRDLRPGKTMTAQVGPHDLVLYRDEDGVARAADRACGHMGADLSQGTVVAKGLRCPFHAWCWDHEGTCSAGGGVGSGLRIRTYRVDERWGLLWVWGGDTPDYDLPSPRPENRLVLRLRSRRIGCHPHVMLGNGLDVSHVVPVHGFHLLRDPQVDIDAPHRMSATLDVRFGHGLLRRLVGIAGRTARWRFTTIGPSLAWVEVLEPTPFELLWAGRPLPDGGTATQTIFFLPHRRAIFRALPTMIATTIADRDVLDGIRFTPNFLPSDAPFSLYADLIEGMPEW